MTLLETPRSRTVVLATALTVLAMFCFLFTLQVVQAHAAKRAILAEQDRLYAQLASEPGSHSAAIPVLVELFTSEGCSSCPPADALLARLDHDQPVPNADIIILGEHVDYWDGQGWHDRFSSHQFTERQTAYAQQFRLDSPYTPQMIVDGSAQLNGTDGRAIEKAIERASESEPAPLQFTSVDVQSNRVTFSLRNGPDTPGLVNVYAALVDPSDTTEVRGGENGGRTLHHAGVVRTFAQLGSAWRTNKLGEHPFTVQSHGPASPNGMRLVVFVQGKPLGPVRGAVACSLGPAGPTSGSSVEPCPVTQTSTAAVQ